MQANMSSQTPTIEPMADLSANLKLQQGHRFRVTEQRLRTLYILSLILSDALMVGLGFFLAYYIRFHSGFFIFNDEVIPSFAFYSKVTLLGMLPLWLGLFGLVGLYNYRNLLGGLSEYTRVFHASSDGLLIVIFFAFLIEDFMVARGWLLLAWFFNFLLVAGARFSLRRLVYAFRRRGYFLTPALLIGDNGEARLLAHQLSTWPTSGLNLLGLVGDALPPGQRVVRNLYSLGKLADLPQIVERYGVKELIVASSALSREALLDIFQTYGFSKKMNIRFSSGLFEIMTTGLHVKELAYTSLIGVNQVRLTGVDRFLKATMDYGLTLIGLCFLFPIFVVIGLLIKWDSPGPILHRRRVVGVNGQQFDAFKFRTMYTNGDEILQQHPELQAELAQTHKLKDDPRITRVGHFLRKVSLDELPQLFNVLLGQMSLIGPRMISPPELNNFGQWEMNLLTVKPGLTGLWQISGRSDLSYEERVRLDMHYIRNHTIWLDIYILWQTPFAVLKGRGAY